jgi:hypothetical protein
MHCFVSTRLTFGKRRASHIEEAIADFQLLGEKIIGLRLTRNLQPPRCLGWVRCCLERKSNTRWHIPKIRIWGSGDEPPTNGYQSERKEVKPRLAIDLTLEELIESYSLTKADYDALCCRPWTLYQREPLEAPDMRDADGSKCVGGAQEDVLTGPANHSLHDEDISSNGQGYLADDNEFTYPSSLSVSVCSPVLSPSVTSVALEDDDGCSDGSSSPRTPDADDFHFLNNTTPELNNRLECKVSFEFGALSPDVIDNTTSPLSVRQVFNHYLLY